MDDPHAEYRIAVADSDKNDLLDRLSELPNSLIFVILSYLPMADVVQTTLLSNRWKDVWRDVPCLDFKPRIYSNFLPPEYHADKFRNFVNGALAHWKGTKILKFSLDCMLMDSIFSEVDSWLQFAIERQVEELYISLIEYLHIDFDDLEEAEYYAPECLYSCSTIRKLSLSWCKFKIIENVQWNQLKSLTIEGPESLDECAMNQILSGSPQLEELNLRLYESSENFNIRSISLKMLVISYLNVGATMLRIWAPNLETLDISQCLYDTCLLCVPSLKNAVLGFCGYDDSSSASVLHEEMLRHVMLSICHVEKVTLSYWCTKTLLQMKDKDIAVASSEAKFLKLVTSKADEILGVLNMFPNLMVLIVDLNINPHFRLDDYIERKCSPSTPSLLHLERAEINWHIRDEASITRAIAIILENARLLKKMVFRVCCRGESLPPFTMVEENVRSMPRSSSTAEVIVKEL